ncbi:hypothetical protein BXZ70DRAFT_925740 [Cristinia sonorae]|uniref:Uncharacterized protein n=1 Tax=Cristinia sonorae TaxID=1940300 RepID=A0A8K0XSU2_9AGAR|nr:hypothetical protein BXZ70DRAFT_925740 [Cristinia sonorae]
MVFLVFLCGMFSPAANIYNFARPHTYVFNPNQGTCYTSPTPEAIRRTPKIMPVLVRSITMLGDLLLLAITWNKSYAVFKISRRTRNFKPKFAVLVLRDGTLYFIALATLNLAVLLQVIFGIYLDKNGGTTFIFVSEAVTCILIARFILNLRGIAGDMNADDGDMSMAENESGHRVSTLNFATPTVLGNLAAPLRTPFISDDDDSYRAYLRARQPFLVGLEPDRHSGSDTTSAGMMTQRIAQAPL